MNPNHTLTDRVAIVTGAAQGIGRGIAVAMAQAGADVVVADVNEDGARDAARELEQMGSRALALAADVTDGAHVDNLMEQTVSHFGRLDVLVNNAGVVILKAIEETSDAEWDRVLDTNLKGTFLCCRSALPHLERDGGGSIVNISSIAAFAFTTPHISYAASKAGISALTRDLACEVARKRIRVNAIAPGPIETAMFDSLTQAQRDAHAEKVPVGRLGKTKDIGDAAVFLASEAAGFITGVTLPVTGGSDLKIT